MYPDIIVPFQTGASVDLKAYVTLGGLVHTDINCAVYFVQAPKEQTYPGIITNLSPNVEHTLSTVTANKDQSFFNGIQASGDTDATFIVYINGASTFKFHRSSITENINYSTQLPLNVGDVVSLTVTNTDTSGPNSFQGTILASV